MPSANFDINPALTAIAVGYKNPDAALIADQVMPRVPTAETFKYTVYDTAQAFTVPPTQVGRRSAPNIVTFGGTAVTDTVLDYGLDDPIPQRDIDVFNSMPKPPTGGPLEPTVLSTMMLSGLIDLDREIRVAGTVFNAANYATGKSVVLSGTSQWSDFVNSDPLSALLSALDQPLVRPDTLTVGQDVWTQLRQHPKIVQAVFKTAQTGGSVSKQQIADLLEIRQVLVGSGWVNTARKGQAPALQRVWGKNAALTYSSAGAAQMFQPVWGWTANWGGKFAGTIQDMKQGLKGSVTVRVGEQLKELVSAPDAGYYFANAVA